MTEPEWRGVVNAVLYVVQFEPRIDDDAVVADRVQQLQAAPPFGLPVPRIVAALRVAWPTAGRWVPGSRNPTTRPPYARTCPGSPTAWTRPDPVASRRAD